MTGRAPQARGCLRINPVRPALAAPVLLRESYSRKHAIRR